MVISDAPDSNLRWHGKAIRLLSSFTELAQELKLSDLAAASEAWRQSLEDEVHNLVFIGTMGSGKSTLINALLGDEALPTPPVPGSTTLVTNIRSGNITRVDRIQGSTVTNAISEPDSDLKVLRGALEQIYRANSNVTDESLDVTLAASYISPNHTIIDTPGIGSMQKSRDITIWSAMARATTLIMVLDATHALSLNETKFIQRRMLENGIRNTFFVLNKMDLITDLDEQRRVVDRTRERLRSQTDTPAKLFPVSSRLALNALMWQQDKIQPSATQISKFGSPENLLSASGFDAFRSDLLNFSGSNEWMISQMENTMGRLQIQMDVLIQRISKSDHPILKDLSKNPSVGEWVDSADPTKMEAVEQAEQAMTHIKEAISPNLAPKPEKKVTSRLSLKAKSTRQTVFVSYSRRDYEGYVFPLLQKLIDAQIPVWIDQERLQDGDWMDQINEALEICDRMVLCVSPEALGSRFVKLEYRYFFNNGKKIYPVLCRDVGTLPPELSSLQYKRYGQIDQLVALLGK